MNKFNDKLPIENITNIKNTRGGDVNDAYIIETADDKYFMLVQKNRDQSFYNGEVEGLKLFEQIGVTGPRVIVSGQIEKDAYLIISFLEEGVSGSQAQLAEQVARLHKYHNPDEKFGFDYPHGGSDTFFTNDWTDSWLDIIVNQRLDVLSEMITDMGLWNQSDIQKYNKVRQIIIDELNNHDSKPSLLHGDLWGGNYMFLKDGRPALFDPSPLYGDREFDIGITTVFGGFDREFYEKYNELYPLEDGWQFRIEFYRLYLYMVHMVKFGNPYRSSTDRTLDRILKY